jgi:uncharacterized protein YgiM (DUF1202 family)
MRGTSKQRLAWLAIGLASIAVAGACTARGPRSARAPVEPAAVETRIEVVTAKSLNLRSGPGSEHALAGKLVKGDRVRVLGEQGDWKHVQSEKSGSEGWASARYLR